MAPLKKAAARPPRSPTEDGFPEQAGRSASGMAAQAAAAALESQRNAAREGQSLSSPLAGEPLKRASQSTPNLRKMHSYKRLSSSPPKGNAAYAPFVPSPLNPNSPPDSLKSRNSNEERLVDTADESPAGSRAIDIEAQAGSVLPSASSPKASRTAMLKVPSMSQINLREPSPSRLNTPMSVRDLGSDYTRYFNPFSDSRRSSTVDPSSGTQTPLLRYQNNRNPSRLSVHNNPFDPVSEKSGRSSLDSNDPAKERQALLFSPFLDDRLASSPYLSKGKPYAFPMFVEEKEDDDDMHMPMPDDNVRFKPRWRDHFSRDNVCSTIGLILMVVGLLFLFIVMPIMFYTGTWNFLYAYETPLDEFPGYGQPEAWATVNDRTYPLLKNLRSTLVDPATPSEAYTRKSYDGSTLNLVFSDEFNDRNRSFYDGDDPYWFAGDFWYGATQDLDWYDPDAVTTWDGALQIQLDAFHNHNLNFRSGMLNSWNHLCFKGGVFEVSISLPGPAGVMGLWPGAWTMGNLGRPGYLSTTDGMWPYTYNDCDAGITPNQSDPSGLSHLPGQRLPSCTCPGEDHPNPGTGRGAPEIDILEASASYQVKNLGVITQSFQVAPFDPWYEVDYEYMAFPNPNISFTNTYTGGPFQQAVSGTTTLNNDWYDGTAYQSYSFEYRPGAGENGWITWFVGDDVMFTMDGRAIRANGNVGDRIVSEEPMSMILNLGFSNSWVAIDWQDLKFPTIMRVDYVRIYQPDGEEMITCDPPGYETTQYIQDHMEAYTNPNYTKWDETGYSWPKHQLNSNC